MKTYSEKLQHPNWQRKRLEILNRDNFTCQACGDTETQLQVHHLRYTTKQPYDEVNENLITYCDHCHTFIHEVIKMYKERLKYGKDNFSTVHIDSLKLNEVESKMFELSNKIVGKAIYYKNKKWILHYATLFLISKL